MRGILKFEYFGHDCFEGWDVCWIVNNNSIKDSKLFLIDKF